MPISKTIYNQQKTILTRNHFNPTHTRNGWKGRKITKPKRSSFLQLPPSIVSQMQSLRLTPLKKISSNPDLSHQNFGSINEYKNIQKLSSPIQNIIIGYLELIDDFVKFLEVGEAIPADLVFFIEYVSDLNLSKYKGISEAKMLMMINILPNLKSIKLPSHTSQSIIKAISKIYLLEFIDLEDCSELTDNDLSELSKLPDLNTLILSGCTNITGEGFKPEVKNTVLKSLDLSRCSNITDAGLYKIAEFSALRFLNINGCDKISYQGLCRYEDLRNSYKC